MLHMCHWSPPKIERKNGAEVLFEDETKTFPKLAKFINPQIQEIL